MQRLYAEGLASGFLQHWSTGGVDGVDGVGVGDVLVDGSGSTIAEQLVLTDQSNDRSNPPDSLLYTPSSDDYDEEDEEMKGELTLPIPNDDIQGDVSQQSVDDQKNALISSLSSTSILPPRLLDLHGFPLPVAKAAIDYMLKELHQEFGRKNPVEGLVDEERGGKGKGKGGDMKVVDFDVHVVTGRGTVYPLSI